MAWQYVPAIESGTDAVCGMNFSCTDPRQFWRLVHTDMPTGGNALTADFDFDGISNADEVSIAYGTNPFLPDTDWDGFTDMAEILAGSDPKAVDSVPAGGGTTTSNGPLNPDSTYRRGLRLAFSRKSMRVQYEGYKGAYTSHDSWGEGWHSKNAGTEYFYPYEESDEEDLTDAVKQAYESASFQSPDQYLFPTEATSDHMLESWEQKFEAKPAESSGTTQVRTYLLRSSLEVQAQASPAAPAEAQRTVTVFLYKGSTDLDNLEKTGTITFSKTNVDFTGALTDHCKPSGVGKVKIERKLEKDPKNESNNDKITSTNQHFYLQLMSVGIEPEAGMAGVIGDIVKPVSAGSRVRHFVTPKKSTELAQPYVELKAEGADETQFSELFQWEYEGNGQIGSAANKFRVKRDAPGLTKVKIKTRHDGVVVDEMHVWVVWAPVIAINEIGVAPGAAVIVDVPTPSGPIGTKSGTSWKFEALIQPSAIIIGSGEIPDLRGAPTNPDRPPESAIGNHALDGLSFADPGSKWDLSRCWRARTIAPTVSASECEVPAGTIIAGDYPTPAAGKVHATTPNAGADHFPSNKLEGNDYRSALQNPYTSGGAGVATPGKLVDDDAPVYFVKTSAGAVGDMVETRYHFGAFSRLQIGEKWYRISDRTPWRFHAKYLKVGEAAYNQDYNGDGDKFDEVWIDAGTISDDTNEGFEP